MMGLGDIDVSDEVTKDDAVSKETAEGGTTNDAGTVNSENQNVGGTGTEAEKAEAEKAKGKSVFDQARYKYAPNEHKTASGRASVDAGDQVAVALRGKDADAVVALVESNGGVVKPTWAKLNPGLRRMSASNVLRGLLAKNGKLTVDGNEIAYVPKPKPAAPASAPAEGAANTETTDTAAA